MQQIKWSDIKIIALSETVERKKISDEEYFSKEYSHYISNSRLKYINPDQGGSPEAYLEGMKQESTMSLAIGSAVHELFLQGDEFILVEGLNKPTAKLGAVIDRAKHYRANGLSILESIKNASKDVDYYSASLTNNRIKMIVKEGLHYYINSKELTDQHIVLSNKETDVVKECLNSLKSNKKITDLVQGTDWAGDPIESYNEDALFIDVKISYKDKEVILKLKMKADNWTIDPNEKIITLNDLKTTGKPVPYFMKDYGSFVGFHYARQMAMYSWILKNYCKKEYNCDKTWKCNSNIIAVETVPPYRARCFSISTNQIKEGMIEFTQLLKRVAILEMLGLEVEFIN